jgi:hypothetical protein
MKNNMPVNCSARLCAVFVCAFFSCAALAADSGFYADISALYLSNTLQGIAADTVQGVEPALNGGYQFTDTISAGLSTNISLGYYNITGDLTDQAGPRYTTTMVKSHPLYRFDIFLYMQINWQLTYWVSAGLGFGPEISIYQYMFNNYIHAAYMTRTEIVGTQVFSLGLIPQIQFKIYEHIIFGIRMYIVPFSITGKSVYVFYFSGDTREGYNSFDAEGISVQNHLFKFGVYAGYFFGKPYYKPRAGAR